MPAQNEPAEGKADDEAPKPEKAAPEDASTEKAAPEKASTKTPAKGASSEAPAKTPAKPPAEAAEKPPAKAAEKPPAKPEGSGASGARAADATEPGSSGAAVALGLAALGLIALGYILLREDPKPTPAPPRPAQAKAPSWEVGQTVDVEIVIAPDDVRDYACASRQVLDGRHCAFEAPGKPWPGGDEKDDAKLLRPYATPGAPRLIAAGLPSMPVMQGELPKTRFRMKCKLAVEGKIAQPQVRWKAGGEWRPAKSEWPVGTLSSCSIVRGK